MSISKLINDSDTIGTSFSCISCEEFPVTAESIMNMEKYRNSLDERMIKMNPRDKFKQLFMDESKAITHFLNRYKL